MRLRKQLFIISLITLTLPWVGCQYVKEIDSALRQGQTQALAATAKAIAARLGSTQKAVSQLKQFASPPNAIPVYYHPLPSAVILDGYTDDWKGFNKPSQTLFAHNNASAQVNSKVQVTAGSFDNQLYLLLDIEDHTQNYYSPGQNTPFTSDNIVLHLLSEQQKKRELVVYASGSGLAKISSVSYAKSAKSKRTGTPTEPETRRKLAIEHGVKGFWHETNTNTNTNTSSNVKANPTAKAGYQVELKIPLAWADSSLGIRFSDLPSPTVISNFANNTSPPNAILLSSYLNSELSVFNQDGLRLSLASTGSRLVAYTGDIAPPSTLPAPKSNTLLKRLYRFIISKNSPPPIKNYQQAGYFNAPEITLSLEGSTNTKWYQDQAQHIVRVSVPIFDHSHNHQGESNAANVIGVIVAEQSADTLATMTTSMLNTLILYSLFATFTASFCLIIYASWLSHRLSKLSHAAANAISESGKITEHFPVFRYQDEIGDLSTSFSQLLTRLKEYTSYLRTLSSKLSHELRTPLAIVSSSLDNLEHERLSKQAKTYAERAKSGTKRLSNILNAMSAASRVEQAIGAAERENIPCDDLLSHLKAAYEDVYTHVSFKLNIRGESRKLKLWGAGELIVQMLDKLIDNAADFCPNNGMIELGLYRHDNDIVFTVRNEGPPLPTSMHGQLFDSMVSVRDTEAATDESDHHLGLGLYIVRLIADFHGGEVQCYNIPDNSGVIFEVRLPTK